MKLAYIVPSRIPGHAANAMQVMKMAEALLGLDPGLLMVAATGEDGPADLRSLYGVTRLPGMVRLTLNGRLGPHLFGLRAALLARRKGTGLVLTRSVIAAAWAAGLGLPTVFECHAPPQGAERFYWRRLTRASGFRRLVVISQALVEVMAERHPETAGLDVVVAHDGVEPAAYAALPEPAAAKAAAGFDPARPVAGYAGHLYAGRGIDIVLACAAALPGWDFLIAGGTPRDVARWQGEAARAGLANLRFLGFIDNALLPGRMAVCDVLLMPYQKSVMVSGNRLDTARWMSPLKMFEYLALGRAIVSSDLPVLREVLDDNLARLVPPDDASAWVAALRGLEDAGARARLAAAARAAVPAYSWETRVRRMTEGLVPA